MFGSFGLDARAMERERECAERLFGACLPATAPSAFGAATRSTALVVERFTAAISTSPAADGAGGARPPAAPIAPGGAPRWSSRDVDIQWRQSVDDVD